MLKEATTKNPIIDVIKKRWSNRAFSDHSISIAEIETLFETYSPLSCPSIQESTSLRNEMEPKKNDLQGNRNNLNKLP
jgi:hypothetical protein